MAKKKVKSKATKPSPAVKCSLTNTINEDVIAAALSSINSPILVKVCRLCESKDGPFLNIFESDKATAKKIEELMPFGIAEYDDLPHKICFRCSAKVEELHEFVQKCVKTQKSLHEALGKKAPLLTKNKVRSQWEEKLNKSNISNDDICDALIKKAMEGIKDIPLNPMPPNESEKSLRSKGLKTGIDSTMAKKDLQNELKVDSNSDVALKHVRLSIEKCDNKIAVKTSDSNDTQTTDGTVKSTSTFKTSKGTSAIKKRTHQNASNQNEEISKTDNSDGKKEEDVPPVKNDPPFNIMDYVTTIKVNSVGILFQCKLCNRNFLKKEVVETHGCAKTGIPKIDLTVNVYPPEPPKPPNTVKYIKIDNNTKRPAVSKNKEEKDSSTKVTHETNAENSKPTINPKPKIGPACKMKKNAKEKKTENESQMETSVESKTDITSDTNTKDTPLPTVTIPTTPSFNLLYKLVPGPNNTFTLVNGQSIANQETIEDTTTQKVGKKRKNSNDSQNTEKKDNKKSNSQSKSKDKTSGGEVIDLENEPDKSTEGACPSAEQPYPVGLFQTRPHHSTTYPTAGTSETPAFTTPAMKKQSYTVVQTGNPSKLVISTKSVAPTEEVPKKRVKKNKTEENPNVNKAPYNVTIEEHATQPKDPGFFTFINVDPLLQPSYVLPTDNIIQESQISTSTPAVKNKTDIKDKYSCNMCGEKFSREKKLLTHIQSHYSKMDEEDKLREKTLSKRRGKKS